MSKATNKAQLSNTKIIKPGTQFENVGSTDHSFVYTDNTQVSLSLFDIKLIFGVTQGRTPEGKIRVMNHTTLAMSPQHAKALMELLQQTIKRYEEDFIPLPLKKDESDFEEV